MNPKIKTILQIVLISLVVFALICLIINFTVCGHAWIITAILLPSSIIGLIALKITNKWQMKKAQISINK